MHGLVVTRSAARRVFRPSLVLVSLILGGCALSRPAPNVIVIFADDQGYADVGCYGAEGLRTPHLDRLAEQGMRFTDFYVASPVCSPSRAALLTGRLPQEVGFHRVLFPQDSAGLNGLNPTLPEVLRDAGYATCCVGKWHLGHLPPFLPTRHGFDEFFGVPYSHDMDPTAEGKAAERPDPPLPLMRGEEVIEPGADPRGLTLRYTAACLDFLERNRDRRFFLYFAHSMPHVPWHSSPAFTGRSERGDYGDCVEELDFSVGAILGKLDELGLTGETLVLFTSDNGPSVFRSGAGRADPLRGGKNTTWEGGMRVPCIVRWPGVVPAGSICEQPCTTLDLLPSFAAMAGAEAPDDLTGWDLTPLLLGQHRPDYANRPLIYGKRNRVEAVRYGKYKLHLVRRQIGEEQPSRWALFDLDADIGETENLHDRLPRVVRNLRRHARAAEAQIARRSQPWGTLEDRALSVISPE